MRRVSICAFMSVIAMGASGLVSRGDAHVFVLKRDETGLVLERVTLADGESKTWRSGEEGFIDVVLPPAPGGSGSIVMHSMAAQTTAACEGGSLVVKTAIPGKTYDRQAPDAHELAGLDVRVSAHCGDGAGITAFIRGYERVEIDRVGPLEDMFAGAVPLQPADCAITTNTFASRGRTTGLKGSVAVRMEAGHHIATATIGAGSEASAGDFVIDLAAASTVIARGALPPGVAIEPSMMTQYTPEGVQRLATEVGGATGKAAPVGVAKIPVLTFGDMRLTDVSVLVMSDLPALGGKELAGVIGLDVLGQASCVSVPYGMAEGQRADMRLGSRSEAEPTAAIPLSIFGNRAYGRVSINGHEAVMIVDTGSPWTIVDKAAAETLNLVAAPDENKDIRGIGATALSTSAFTAETIQLGTMNREHVVLRAGALAVFKTLRGSTPVGLLGNDVLGWADRVEVDFERSELRLVGE